MPSCLLGVCSWQGETLWLVDLNHFAGYLPLCEQHQLAGSPFVMVVQSGSRALGLVVAQVDDVALFDEATIRAEPGLCPPSLAPYVLGYCANQGDMVQGDMVQGGMVLNVAAIVEAPLWQTPRSS